MEIGAETDRRSLLRRGVGAALLAIAGGGVVAATTANEAEAATGDPLILGQSNSGGVTFVDVSELIISGGTAPGPVLSVSGLGTTIPLRLGGAPASGMPPTSGGYDSGSLAVANKHLWYCYEDGAGSNSLWTRISSPSLNLLPAPFRVYDSRPGQPNPSGAPKGAIAFGDPPRTVSCQSAVSAQASGILFNLTVAETISAGALLVWAAGQTEPLASSINWTDSQQVIANSVTSTCDPSQAVQVSVSAGITGASTHFVLDVIGFYA